MQINYRKWGLILAGAALLGDIALFNFNDKARTNLASAKIERTQAIKSEMSQKHKNKHPVIRKTVPSSYKKMLSTGKTVSHAENTILRLFDNSNGHPKRSSETFQHAHNVLNQYTDGGTDDNFITLPWTHEYSSHVKLIPGASSMTGTCEGAFAVINHKGQVIRVISAQFEPSKEEFVDMNSYSVKDPSVANINSDLTNAGVGHSKSSASKSAKQPVRKPVEKARRK